MDTGQRRRLIPAHAGKTHPGNSRYMHRLAHPRSRGENVWMPVQTAWIPGSSPLTRGKHCVPHWGNNHPGLIPAHAGKTRHSDAPTAPMPAHPRSRGENLSSPPWWSPSHGSSPLTRGKRLSSPARGEVQGLIPAHAGKTWRGWAGRRPCWAHPRSRGENGLLISAN